jgi:hypothetical protein
VAEAKTNLLHQPKKFLTDYQQNNLKTFAGLKKS